MHYEGKIQNRPYLKNLTSHKKELMESKIRFRKLRIFWDNKKNQIFRLYRDDLKLTISQKLKIAQKKLMNTKIRFRKLRIFSRLFFHIWLVKTLGKTLVAI